MKTLVINSAEPEVTDFTDPLITLCREMGLSYQLSQWRDLAGSQDIGSWHAVIISASPMGNNANFEERLHAFRWLKNTQNKVFGICAGHQLLGCSFGSKLIQNKESERGMHKVRIHTFDPVFQNTENEIEVLQQHHDSITLPDDFNLLARSDRCRIQAMKHKERPLYSVQWHAEISTLKIISNFLK